MPGCLNRCMDIGRDRVVDVGQRLAWAQRINLSHNLSLAMKNNIHGHYVVKFRVFQVQKMVR